MTGNGRTDRIGVFPASFHPSARPRRAPRMFINTYCHPCRLFHSHLRGFPPRSPQVSSDRNYLHLILTAIRRAPVLVILAGLSLPPTAVSDLLTRILRVEVVTHRFPIVRKCLLEEAPPSPTKLASVVEVPGVLSNVRTLSSPLFPPGFNYAFGQIDFELVANDVGESAV